jgi:glycosyltransferase involved in cell wall biosynthesis
VAVAQRPRGGCHANVTETGRARVHDARTVPPATGASHRDPVRVLFVNDTARNGGPGRSLQSLLVNLDPARFHRTVLLPRPGPIADALRDAGAAERILFEPSWVENVFEPWGRPVERCDLDAPWPIRGARFAGNIARMARALGRLAREARRHDVIHCNGTIAGFVGGLASVATGVPALWHVRYTSLPPAARPLHDWLATRRAIRHIVCVSRPAAALFPDVQPKVSVIHNGVDLRAWEQGITRGQLRASLGLSPDAVIVGAHGRVLRKKGFVELLKAARVALALLGPDERSRCRFVIVGDTPQDFRPDHLEECRQLAAALDLLPHTTFLGFRADVRPLVADFDVAVVPSVYPDPLPRSVIESMAVGKPVIAYAVGGVAEMLGPDEGELLPDDERKIESLAAAIVRYVRDPELRARQGLAAARRVRRDFDARAHAERVGLLLAEAAGGGDAPALSPRTPARYETS